MKYLKILSIFCIFCFVFTLSSCNNENYSNLPSGSETENPVNDDEDIELNDNEGDIVFCSKDFQQEYKTREEFENNANINGKLLKEIWNEVSFAGFMFCE